MARLKQLARGGARSSTISIVILIMVCALTASFCSAASAARARHNCLSLRPAHAVHAGRLHGEHAREARRAQQHRKRRCGRHHSRASKRFVSTMRPSAPTALSAVAGDTQVALAWGASTAKLGVAGYRVYRNGARVAQVQRTIFTDTGLTNGTTYSYYTVAYDSAGNVSAPSNVVSATPIERTSPSAPSANPQPMPVGDVPGWHQVFADDFATPGPLGSFAGCGLSAGLPLTGQYCSGLQGTPYYEKWFAYPDGWSGTPTTGTYLPSKTLSMQNGLLDYYIHSEGGVHMIDAPEPKIPGGVGSNGGLLYGRYVVRARWDALSGYHVSFLLWPDSEVWPRDGEIDFPEADFDSTTVAAFMHHLGATSGGEQDAYSAATTPQQWHTYEIDWLPTEVAFYLDGSLIGRSTANIPNTPMHWVLQTGTSFGEPTPSEATAGHVQVAWAVAYTPA